METKKRGAKCFAFIGEKRSDRAVAMKVTWQDGRLAAKQLFDALKANGIDPHAHAFDNWFEGYDAPARIKVLQAYGYTIVAMGEKVSKAMAKHGVAHLKLVHPAARGHIRRKDRYAAHVGEILGGTP